MASEQVLYGGKLGIINGLIHHFFPPITVAFKYKILIVAYASELEDEMTKKK